MQSLRRALRGRPSLWSNQDFLRFWLGETIANFGSQLAVIAIPLIAAITLSASPLQMGLLTASASFPRMIVGIFAGAWVDRRKRRPVMIAVNITRAVTLLIIPVAALFGDLTFPLLLTVAILMGVQGILFDSAWSAMVPTLVDREYLADANGKLWASMSLAQITGPAFAGTLIAWLGGPNVLALTSVSFIIAASFIHRIVREEPDAVKSVHGGPKEMIDNIREGYAELIHNPITRPLTTTMLGIGFGTGIFTAVFVLLLANELHLTTRGVGLVFAAEGVGALVGSVIAAPAAKRFGVGPVVLWGAILQSVALLLVPFAFVTGRGEITVVVIGTILCWMFFQAYDINRFSLRQAITRPNLMGRVASSTMTLMAAGNMIGALLGGIIGEIWGIRAALAVSALIMLWGSLLTWRSPIPAIMEMPSAEDVPRLLGQVPPDEDEALLQAS